MATRHYSLLKVCHSSRPPDDCYLPNRVSIFFVNIRFFMCTRLHELLINHQHSLSYSCRVIYATD